MDRQAFPLIKLAKKLKEAKSKRFFKDYGNWLFPLIKLAKKLKVPSLPEEPETDVEIQEFPLIKLAKKLKASATYMVASPFWFPLIKLAKKLKALSNAQHRILTITVSIN